MTRILVCTLLILSANSAIAASVAIYKDKRGQVLLTNVQPSGKFDNHNKKVRETYYRSDSSNVAANTTDNMDTVVEKKSSGRVSYSQSAYAALR